MRLLALATWLGGLALLVFLLAESDGRAVLDTVASLHGWLVIIIVIHALPLFIDALAWRCVFPQPRPSLRRLSLIRWIGESTNGLLPVPQLGEVARARLAGEAGNGIAASASVMVDLTLGIATQVVFTLIGLVIFAFGHGSATLPQLALSAVALTAIAAGFFLLQRSGMLTRGATLIARLGGNRMATSVAGANRLDAMLRQVYGDRRAVAAGLAWRFVGWFAGAGEVWLTFYALGHPVTVADAIALESLSQAVRAAAFIVPGGLGVQDGALMLLAAQMGLGAELGLALSLVKRCREIAMGLPGLAVGAAVEAQRWPGSRPAALPADEGER